MFIYFRSVDSTEAYTGPLVGQQLHMLFFRKGGTVLVSAKGTYVCVNVNVIIDSL